MGQSFDVTRLRRAAGAGLLSGILLMLAGCGGSETARNVTSVFMGPDGGATFEMEGERPEPPGGPRCPMITVRDGTEALRNYERGREGDPVALRYQGTVTRVARECSFTGDNHVRIRFGVAGRLITGQAGSPGNYELPLRVAMVRQGSGGQAVWSQLYRVPVTVEPGQGSGNFSLVAEDIEFTLPAGDGFGWYVVYAGFDEMQ
jgi:hypothetical protein